VVSKDQIFRILRPIIHLLTDKKRERVIQKLSNELLPTMKFDTNSIVLDLGANRGDFSRFASRTAGLVMAFEPNPVAYKYLHKRLKGHPNITLVPAAVSDRNGFLDFFLHGDSKLDPLGYSIRSSLEKKENNYVLGDFKVLALDFEGLLTSLPEIHCLKIDIEGAEKEIWPTIMKFKKKIKFLLVEVHDVLNPGLREDIQSFISSNNLREMWTANWQ